MSESTDDLERRSSKQGLTFPYTNLEDAMTVVKAMYEAGSVPLARDQIALAMRANPDSSTFATKVSSAQNFGLIHRVDGKLQLTTNGSNTLSPDENEAEQARIAAFLNVELYRKLVDHFRGKILPPKEGIEAAMVNFGVAPKQKERARQSFERSAAFVGYLNAAKDRLVPPILAPHAAKTAAIQAGLDQPLSPDEPIARSNGRADDPSEEKLIRGMLDRLPPLGTTWPVADRARWLRRLSHNLAMVYDANEEAEIEVRVGT